MFTLWNKFKIFTAEHRKLFTLLNKFKMFTAENTQNEQIAEIVHRMNNVQMFTFYKKLSWRQEVFGHVVSRNCHSESLRRYLFLVSLRSAVIVVFTVVLFLDFLLWWGFYKQSENVPFCVFPFPFSRLIRRHYLHFWHVYFAESLLKILMKMFQPSIIHYVQCF